jgi:hypothetical protein
MGIGIDVRKGSGDIKIIFHNNYFSKKIRKKIKVIKAKKFKKVKILASQNEIIIKMAKS